MFLNLLHLNWPTFYYFSPTFNLIKWRVRYWLINSIKVDYLCKFNYFSIPNMLNNISIRHRKNKSRNCHLEIPFLSTANLAMGKARRNREPKLGCRGAERTGWCDALPPPPKENLHEICRMGRRIVVMNLICSLGHCEWDDHTVHKLGQRRLTADWLAPRESDCSRMHSKVSSDWLPSYIKATRPVLEIFKMARYFPDSPRI